MTYVGPTKINGSYGVQLTQDPARSRRSGTADGNQIAWGTVGHEDPNPMYVRIENGQPWVEVTLRPEGDEIVARLIAPLAGGGTGWYMPVEYGCRVAVEFIDGDPNDAVITGRLWDEQCAMPGDVAGVQTGAAGKVGPSSGPAPAWQFMKTASGQMLAIETGSQGDVVIHSGAGVHIKTAGTGAVHLEGAVHLGSGPTVAPTGATVGPAGEQIPGVPSVPHVPIPLAPVPNSTPAHVPFVGNEDSIVRAKQEYQFTAVTDPVGYAFFAAVYAHPLIGLPPPQALVCQLRGGKPGSKHTASD